MPSKKSALKKTRGRVAGVPSVSGSTRAGIIFSTGRMNRLLREGRFSLRQGKLAGVFMAGALEYLTNEVLDIAGELCLKGNKKIIMPKHINLAFRTDMELIKLMHKGIVTQSTVPANIHPSHL